MEDKPVAENGDSQSLLMNQRQHEKDKKKTYRQYQEIKKEQTGNLNRVLALAAFVISLGLSLPHGYNTGVLNPQELHIKQFLNDSYTNRIGSLPSKSMIEMLWSMSVSIYLAGGMAGALSFGVIADKFGRKRAGYICLSVGIVSAIPFAVCQLFNSFELLLLGRVMVGYGCGAGSGLSPLFLTEIAPVNIRGAMGVLHQLMLTIGIVVSQVFGLDFLLGQSHLWPILCALTCAPCLVCAVILPFVPDSPRFLVVQNNDEPAAEKALRSYRQTDDVSAAMLELKMDRRRAELQPPWSIWKILRKRSFRLPLLLVVGSNLAQQLSGINVAFYYSRGILRKAAVPESALQYAVLAIGIINVFMTAISVLLVEKFGRKPLMLISHVGMFAAACLMTLSLNLLFIEADWIAYLAAIAMVSFVIFFAIGLGCIPQFLGSELFLTGPRPPAMALAAFGNWLGNWLVGLLFPFLAAYLGNWCFVPFLVFLAISFTFLLCQLPETKGRTAEEMAATFGTDYGMPKVGSQSSNMIELISDHIVHQPNGNGAGGKQFADETIRQFLATSSNNNANHHAAKPDA